MSKQPTHYLSACCSRQMANVGGKGLLLLPREDNVLNKFRILKERHVQMRKPYQSPGRMKNSSYYIAPVGDRTHDLPNTVDSNIVKVSHALNHSATEAAPANGLTGQMQFSLPHANTMEQSPNQLPQKLPMLKYTRLKGNRNTIGIHQPVLPAKCYCFNIAKINAAIGLEHVKNATAV